MFTLKGAVYLGDGDGHAIEAEEQEGADTAHAVPGVLLLDGLVDVTADVLELVRHPDDGAEDLNGEAYFHYHFPQLIHKHNYFKIVPLVSKQ